MTRVVALVLAIGLLAACGDRVESTLAPEAPTTGSASTPEGGAAATTAAPALPPPQPELPTETTPLPPPLTDPPTTPAPFDNHVPCPPDPATAMTSDEAGPLMEQQWELEADVQAAAAYGATVPDEFASAGFWNGEPVSVIAAFTAHLDEHRAALEPLLQHPDRLIVCTAAVSAVEASRIQDELMTYPESGAITGHGFHLGQYVEVTVVANRADVAENVHATYGTKVNVVLGALPYPAPDPPPAPACPEAIPATSVVDGVSLALDAAPVSIGTAVRPSVALTVANMSGESVEVGDIRQVEVINSAGGVASVYAGFRTGEYRFNTVEPGGSITLDLDIPIASCDLANGYALPPGEYTMVAVTKAGTATATLTVTP